MPSFFGYLNLNDPTKIGNNEAQEALNCRVDKGYLEYATWTPDPTINRLSQDTLNRDVYIDSTTARLLREITSTRIDPVGSFINAFGPAGWNPGTGALSEPKFTADTGTIPIEYALTTYNPETQEESNPYYHTFNSDGATTFEITNLPGSDSVYPEKLELEFRVYRRPVGSGAYLRVPFATIQGYTDNATIYQDTHLDAALGVSLPTVDTYPPDIFSDNRLHLLQTVHNNRLWFIRRGSESGSYIGELSPDGYLLYYSRPYVFGEVRETSYFAFESPIVGLFSANETLCVITQKNIYLIYGDSESDFVVKQVSSSSIGGVMVGTASVEDAVFLMSSSKADRTQVDGVFAVLGSQLVKISNTIENLFPVTRTYAPLPTGKYSNIENTFFSATKEDRFFIGFYGVGEFDSAGLRSLIYDAVNKGFLLGDETGKFYYRSKEFGSPGWWDKARRMFVRGYGDFTVELYGDGEKIDEVSFSISGTTPQTEQFTVPGYRMNYFSYRIIGEQNARIYEFGRKE